ncbi:hypothetical protein Peur_032727 [Populus x canadensis]
MGVNRFHYNLGNGTGAKRFYYADSYHVQHFKPRGPKRWFRNPITVVIVVLQMERKIGEPQFQHIKAGFKGKILSALHPESFRVRSTAQNIIEALQRGFKGEQVWSDMGYASPE